MAIEMLLMEVIDRLDQVGQLAQSQGAKVVYPEGFADRDGHPFPMIVQKGDGGYLYATTDLAAGMYRTHELGADRVIYVVDARQTQHLAMVFAVLRQSGLVGSVARFDHVHFGTILGSDRTPFKTRVGGTVKLADVLEQMGAVVRRGVDWIEVSRGELRGVDLDLNSIPDAAMTVAITALFAKGKTAIRNVHNWRVKETDRLAAMASELRKVGAEVIEGEDYLEITPPERITAATIDTYNDHRMAMCFSLAALGDAEITINDPGCVSKTFPDYFDTLARITR